MYPDFAPPQAIVPHTLWGRFHFPNTWLEMAGNGNGDWRTLFRWYVEIFFVRRSSRVVDVSSYFLFVRCWCFFRSGKCWGCNYLVKYWLKPVLWLCRFLKEALKNLAKENCCCISSSKKSQWNLKKQIASKEFSYKNCIQKASIALILPKTIRHFAESNILHGLSTVQSPPKFKRLPWTDPNGQINRICFIFVRSHLREIVLKNKRREKECSRRISCKWVTTSVPIIYVETISSRCNEFVMRRKMLLVCLLLNRHSILLVVWASGGYDLRFIPLHFFSSFWFLCVHLHFDNKWRWCLVSQSFFVCFEW